MYCFRSLAMLVVCSLTSVCAAQSPQRVYAIGNSLTWDAWRYDAPSLFATSRGQSYVQGLHVRGGMSLTEQWSLHLENPSPPPFRGPFGVDLPAQQWDRIVLQPYFETAENEIAAAGNIIEFARGTPANADADIYIYAPAPALEGGHTDFHGGWLAPYAGQNVQSHTSIDFFATIYDEVKTRYASANVQVGLLPAGEVWAAVADQIDSGHFPADVNGNPVTSSTSLYIDTLHATPLGELTSAATWYAVMTRTNPAGLQLGSLYPEVTQAQADAIFARTWEVVAARSAVTHVLTPGDTNADFRVDFADLLTLAQHYSTPTSGTWATGDFDGDGSIGFGDLLLLAQHYETGSAEGHSTGRFEIDWTSAQQLVPEPAMLSIVAVASVATRRRR